MKIKRLDLILLFVILAVAAATFAIAYVALGNDGAVAVVAVDGEEYTRLPLSEDTELAVETLHGTNIVVVKDGKVFVKEASCPDKICIKTGEANEMKSIVCLPNKLTVSIEEGG